ncbi:MAG: hypothetical protein QM802_04865 [Agriterribacter sp.]
MKKYMLIAVVILFCATVSITGTAQQRSKDTNLNPLITLPFTYTVEPDATSAPSKKMYINDININCLVHFKRKFSNVDNEVWTKQANGEYIASFTADSISYLIHYDKKGKWQSTLKGYKENRMLFDIRDMVKREYYDFAIDHVDEIETFNSNNAVTYLVYMRYKNVTKIIRVSNREMDVWLEMIKE